MGCKEQRANGKGRGEPPEPETGMAPFPGASDSKLSRRPWWPLSSLVASPGLNASPTPKPRKTYVGEEAEASKVWFTGCFFSLKLGDSHS